MGVGDVASSPTFAGGFINLGYWTAIPQRNRLLEQDRVHSHRALYQLVLAELELGTQDRVLEVGCGVGTALIAEVANPPVVHGLDLYKMQVERARRANTPMLGTQLRKSAYLQGSATTLPYADASFTRICAVEVMQHMDDPVTFAHEVFCVLAPGGRFVLANFLPTSLEHTEDLCRLLVNYARCVDTTTPVMVWSKLLCNVGFSGTVVRSVGEGVWEGFDYWLMGADPESWMRNFLPAYRQGLVDYYIISANKPGLIAHEGWRDRISGQQPRPTQG
jgi:ubiquinone/menaquinone biosynthesis C-methylase UbiE